MEVRNRLKDKLDQLRDQLMEEVERNPISMGELSRSLGISHPTLVRFIKEGKNISFKTTLTIIKYLSDKGSLKSLKEDKA